MLPTFANTIKANKNNVVKCFTVLVKQLLGHLCVCVYICVFIYYHCFNGYKVWFHAVRRERKFWENNLYKMDEERVGKSELCK